MDRREALKKLGVGTAVAVGTPLVLDTFNVASAASCGTLTGYTPAPTGTPLLLPTRTRIDVSAPPAGHSGAWGPPSAGSITAQTGTSVTVGGLGAALSFSISYTVSGSGRTFAFSFTVVIVGLIITPTPTSVPAGNSC